MAQRHAPPRRLVVLGSTGSIGVQTLEVVEHLRAMGGAIEVVGLAASSNVDRIAEQASRLGVRHVALADVDAKRAHAALPATAGLRFGPDAAERLVREVECDLVVGAIVGVAGLRAILAAVELGRDVALANKEALVAAGSIVVPAAQRSGARLLPIDSEHAAVWQCLRAIVGPERSCPPCPAPEGVRRLVLTASGGPLREWPASRLRDATPDDALRHPTWDMGPKVTIDTASLTNKALEMIEAHWLFGVPMDRIDVLIHPQSIVHAFVELDDASVLAQLAAPDMRGPIQHAITYPQRAESCARRLDLCALARLEFEPPDPARHPALELARRVVAMGGAAGAVFNAANEAAVEAFLARRVRFGEITALAAEAVGALGDLPGRTLDQLLDADARARGLVASSIGAARA